MAKWSDMNTANNHQAQKTERLTDAFRLFNQLSQNLSESYQGLEAQVAKLNHELVAARNERLNTLIEKEKIAGRLQQLLAALPAGVVVLDAQGAIIDCNGHAVEFLGEPLIGLLWDDVVKRSLQQVCDSPHERQLADGRRLSIIRNYLNNESGQIILLSDISELRSLQDMLAQQKQLSAMGEMVAGLAHQVRTPLATAILYASQMNKPSLDDAKRQQFSAKILERLHHLERQINDMLVFARQGRMTMETFSLTDLLVCVKENMEDQNVEFCLKNHVQADAMLGNEGALRGALMNLLNNAVDAVNGSGKIWMTVSLQDDSCLKITIRDNGPGIDKHGLKRLFEPFYTTKVNGTGLGLAVVNSVVRAHSGSIECQSDVGKGTTFIMILPCVNQFSITLSAEKGEICDKENDYETV